MSTALRPALPLSPTHALRWLLLLGLGVPMLLPFARSAELPLLLGALFGLWALLRRPDPRQWPAALRDLCVVLAAIALAALISALDAVDPAKSWTSAIALLRFLLYGIGLYALLECAGPGAGRALSRGIALLLALWVLDALIQALSGHSLGGPLDADRLSGIFGADDLKLGPTLAVLAPLLLWPLLPAQRADRGRWLLLAVAYVGVLSVILLAGARAGWIMFGWVSLLLAWRLSRNLQLRFAPLLLGAALLGLALGLLAYAGSERFQARVDRTAALFSGEADHALAGRTWIFATAWRMGLAHPLNGVGVRGFRDAYAQHAAPGDPWVDPHSGQGAAHAHQWLLELWSETGALGLLLWLGALAYLYRRLQQLPPQHLRACEPALVALSAMLFPLNTHLAFYSTFWSIVLAWLLVWLALHREEAG